MTNFLNRIFPCFATTASPVLPGAENLSMATQFLPPVSSDAVLKFQIHSGCDRFRSFFTPNILHRPVPSRRRGCRRGEKSNGKRSYSTISASFSSSSSNDSVEQSDVADDYYAVLGLVTGLLPNTFSSFNSKSNVLRCCNLGDFLVARCDRGADKESVLQLYEILSSGREWK